MARRYRRSLSTKQPVVHKFFDELEVEVRGGSQGLTLATGDGWA